MAGYFNIPLEQWETYAQEACLATDHQTKQHAEQFFYMFVQNVHFQALAPLIQRGSDMLLFALFSYLYKSPHALLRESTSFYRLMLMVESWQMRELNFARPNAPLCQSYVTKTIMTALGIFMKILYENSETMTTLIKFIQDLPLTYFKVYLLKTFIEAVETIDTEMGYMRFRTMVYNFQDNVMPMICQNLVPFFQKFEEGVRISELSLMQSKLDFNDDQTSHSIDHEQISLSKEQDMQSQLVLMLLKKIVEFNYNITYTQYESEQAIDTCLITFPDKVLQKIINHQFLNSLFYVIEKVCQTKTGDKKNQFLGIVLECLAKIMQSRLGYVAEDSKQKFVVSAVKGLTNLLKACQQLQSQPLLQGILICNKKLFMSVQITYIEKIINQDEDLRALNLGEIYIRDLTDMILQIVKTTQIQADNNLLNEALEVACKLLTSISFKDSQNMEYQSNFYQHFVRELITSFIGSLCQPYCIFSTSKIIWVHQNKQAVDNLFQQFKRISSYAYQTIFYALDAGLQNCLKDQNLDIAVFANILFLLSELVDHNYLDRNISLNKAKQQEIGILANTVKKATNIATHYVQNRATFNLTNDKHSHYLDIAILLFSQAILVDFLSNFQSVGSIKIKQKLYLIMALGQAYSDLVETQDNNSQSTVLGYLNLIFPFLATNVPSQDMEIKMLYALQIIQKIIFKLKWNMRRQVFLKCNLFKRLLSFFDDYFSKCYPIAEIMAKVGKITVTLNFDDVLDQYKFRINNFIARLPQDNQSHIFYYLTGIFEAIQPGNICKYFCTRLKRAIDMPKFFEQLFKTAIQVNIDKAYKDLIKFCRLIILNKGLKTNSNSTLTYELFNFMLPHLVWFIGNINLNEDVDIDLLGDCISELIDMFCGVINGTHVNMFILDYSSNPEKQQSDDQQSLGVQFVMEYFKMTVILCRKLKMYPKLEESVLNCFVSINKEILEFIYDSDDTKLADVYNMVILTEIDLAVEYICMQLNGNRLVEDKLLKNIDSLRLFYQFFNRKYHMIHKSALLNNLKRYQYVSECQNPQGSNSCKNERLAFYVISLILTNHKNNLSYIRSFTKLIFELNKHFQHHLLSTLVKLNINNSALEEVRLILQQGMEEYEQNFVQKFKGWVKDFNEFK